jgi:hypothetical protein
MSQHAQEVEAWLACYDNPQKPNLLRVRELVLAADQHVTEAIKWQAPTFIYRGNIASFYPKAVKHVSLMFHEGAGLPDPHGLLEGSGEVSRVAKFADAADIENKADALQELIRAWVSLKS